MHIHESNRGVEKQAPYQCSQCQRRYHRTEHLARHVRSIHTKQRPYPCRSCGKAFGRLDILRRHEATHDDEPGTRVLVAGVRVGQACRLCKEAKVKCSERKPCLRCTGKGARCEYGDVRDYGEADEGQRQQDPTWVDADFPSQNEIPPGASRALPNAPLPVIAPTPYLISPHASEGTPTHEEDGYMAGDFSFGVDWDLAMADMAYLQSQFDMTATDTAASPGFAPNVVQQHGFSPASTQTCETLSTATGLWEPQSSENKEMERLHLAADEANLGPPSHGPGPSAGLAEPRFSATARNSLVRMILDNTSHAAAAPVLAAFPSTGALGALVDVYAQGWAEASRAGGINGVVHLPTLELDGQRPELLGMVVALGALGTGSVVARRFGFAMQEVVWVSSFRSWEGNNAALRDVGLSQAFFLQQHMAFFSGVRRKVAFAKACANSIQVLIKNGGHLKGAIGSCAEDPALDDLLALGDDSKELGDAWRRWAAREARRRLVYAAYIMDAHVSMAHETQVLSSYLDMRVPFPTPRGMWKARTAVQWREEMASWIQQQQQQQQQGMAPSPLCLRDVMNDPTLVAKCRGLVDEGFAVLGFLAGLWTLVREVQQLAALGGGGAGAGGAGRHWSSMILSARRVELASVLDLFTSQARTAGVEVSPEAELLVEVLHMHILAVPDGSGSQSTPAALVPDLQSTERRGALWRAGRAVSAAVRFPAGTLCDVYAVALLQAATVLWRQGVDSSRVLGKSPGPGQGLGLGGGMGVCVVDGDGVEEWHLAREGVHLALRGAEGEATDVMLEDAAGVARRVRGVVEGNWTGGRMPSGVEEVCLALGDLERTANR